MSGGALGIESGKDHVEDGMCRVVPVVPEEGVFAPVGDEPQRVTDLFLIKLAEGASFGRGAVESVGFCRARRAAEVTDRGAGKGRSSRRCAR